MLLGRPPEMYVLSPPSPPMHSLTRIRSPRPPLTVGRPPPHAHRRHRLRCVPSLPASRWTLNTAHGPLVLLITTYGVAVSTFRTLWCARNEAGHRLRLAQLRDAHALEYWLVWMFTLPACVSPLFRPLFFFRLCARAMLTRRWGCRSCSYGTRRTPVSACVFFRIDWRCGWRLTRPPLPCRLPSFCKWPRHEACV